MRELKEKWIKEFISLGPEVEHNGQKIRPNTRTSIAIGKISEIKEAGGKNNLKAVMKVTGAKYDFSGFINDNTPASKLLKQAHEEGLTICARFERKRKPNADPTADIKDLTKDTSIAKDNVIWIVAGVFNYNTNEWILSDSAVSNPEEDPSYVLPEIKAASYTTEGFFEGNAPKLKTTDKDWKANHLVSMYNYASEHNYENKLNLQPKELKILATYMLTGCDHLQMKMKNISAPNYNDYSHTKARGMLFSWMRTNPLTVEIMTTTGEFNKWMSRFLSENLEIAKWAADEVEK